MTNLNAMTSSSDDEGDLPHIRHWRRSDRDDVGAVLAVAPLHALCNVAGTGRFAPTDQVEEKEWKTILAVNLDGAFFASQAAIPYLLENPKSAIVNVASVAGLNGLAYSAAYCAAKWGVVGLTKALAVE